MLRDANVLQAAVKPMEREGALERLGVVEATFGPPRPSMYDDPAVDLRVNLDSFSSSAEDFEFDDVE